MLTIRAVRTLGRVGKVVRRIGMTPKGRNRLMKMSQMNLLISAEVDEALEVGEDRATTLVLG